MSMSTKIRGDGGSSSHSGVGGVGAGVGVYTTAAAIAHLNLIPFRRARIGESSYRSEKKKRTAQLVEAGCFLKGPWWCVGCKTEAPSEPQSAPKAE
jgi:hypothetical protein